jgi:glycosyltransferase involved in cell wall biosynthesis
LAFKPVAMSEFGLRECKRVKLDNAVLIPHGVETPTFKPLNKKECRAYLEKHTMPLNPTQHRVKYEKDDFIVGLNCANKDPFRKDYARMFAAFQIFLDQNPDAKKDAKFNVHSWLKFPGGFDLCALARKLDVSQYMKCTFPYDMYCSLPPESLAKMYNGLDVFINLARGEGFGIPIIEAQSCGIPAIVTDFTAMTELVKGHGWLIPPYARDVECPHCKKRFGYHTGAHQMSHLMSLYAIPDEYKAADAIEEAYNKPGKLKRYARKSRRFALKYDFDNVVAPQWLKLIGEYYNTSEMFGKHKRKDEAFDEVFKKVMG